MYSVYCDGSSNGRTGHPVGWGWVVVRDGTVLATGFGGSVAGTNNTAELSAAIDGLRAFVALGLPPGGLELVSDSQYTLGMAAGTMAPNKNLELVGELRGLMEGLGATTRWVRGHAGDPLNEICDRLAKHGKVQHGGVEKKRKRRQKQ